MTHQSNAEPLHRSDRQQLLAQLDRVEDEIDEICETLENPACSCGRESCDPCRRIEEARRDLEQLRQRRHQLTPVFPKLHEGP